MKDGLISLSADSLALFPFHSVSQTPVFSSLLGRRRRTGLARMSWRLRSRPAGPAGGQFGPEKLSEGVVEAEVAAASLPPHETQIRSGESR